MSWRGAACAATLVCAGMVEVFRQGRGNGRLSERDEIRNVVAAARAEFYLTVHLPCAHDFSYPGKFLVLDVTACPQYAHRIYPGLFHLSEGHIAEAPKVGAHAKL